jgi:hypothetical protein
MGQSCFRRAGREKKDTTDGKKSKRWTIYFLLRRRGEGRGKVPENGDMVWIAERRVNPRDGPCGGAGETATGSR